MVRCSNISDSVHACSSKVKHTLTVLHPLTCSGTANCKSWERRNWDQTLVLRKAGFVPSAENILLYRKKVRHICSRERQLQEPEEEEPGSDWPWTQAGFVPGAENILPSVTGKKWVTNRAREPHNFFELLLWAIAGRSDSLKLLLLVGNLFFNSCGLLPIWKQCTGILTGAFLPPSGHREDCSRFDFARQEGAGPVSPPQQLLEAKARTPEQCLRSYLSDSCSSGTLYQCKLGTQESPAEAKGINKDF